MSNLVPFKFESNEIRVVVLNNILMFSARDVAVALGYKNPTEACREHCKYLKFLSYSELRYLNWNSPNPRGEYVMPEGDVYRLAAKSQLESAQRFEAWVYDEVLPTIRKTVTYSIRPQQAQVGLALQYVDRITALLPNLGDKRRQQLLSDASEIDLGRRLIPLPRIGESFYTASSIAEEAGVTPQKPGKVEVITNKEK